MSLLLLYVSAIHIFDRLTTTIELLTDKFVDEKYPDDKDKIGRISLLIPSELGVKINRIK